MIYLYGQHAVLSALDNPKRHLGRLLLSKTSGKADEIQQAHPHLKIDFVSQDDLTHKFGRDAVHQGIALETDPLATPPLEDLIEHHQGDESSLIILLDQVTDPHNVGA
ncbi:MAG TPA: 23S rRNA (guanosine(2251)-2'-O)-methyltransferase RlmB, partial [Holosporales bacterium]|nr:23S rRNA (guanosine(2251)-2'-O)-methyltransferase RlmB [Holosporales bacterium]